MFQDRLKAIDIRFPLAVAAVSLALVPGLSPCRDSSRTIADRYIALAVQGDLLTAQQMLRSMEPDNLPTNRDLRNRFRQRFVERTEPLNPGSGIAVVDVIVEAYRSYWTHSLLGTQSQAQQDELLENALSRVLHSEIRADSEADVYGSLNEAVRALNFGILAVPAPPLQDLFIWRAQRDHEYSVTLTDQSRVVTVAFMSDFVSSGWKDYAALGLATTTGWVEDGVLYCVEQAYVPGTERFEISYLKHEVRHLADFEQFPDLLSAELEYRAKLTELAFASQTLDSLLEDFSAKSAPNSDSPHAVANYRVLRDLHVALFGQPLPEMRAPWPPVDAIRVNTAARGLLRRSTEALESGRATGSP